MQLYAASDSKDFISDGINSQIVEPKYDSDSVPKRKDFTFREKYLNHTEFVVAEERHPSLFQVKYHSAFYKSLVQDFEHCFCVLK